ncbi:MAG: pyruvate kinase [Pseudomonadota bacterium]|nr:pyruvate kinase [Pseudomonadota bacterium]
MRRTKIIATLGPATDDPAVLSQIFAAGVDAVRLNFSHGDYESHARRVKMVRSLQKKLHRDIAIFADLQGPKMRLGSFKDQSISITKGDSLVLDTSCPSDMGDRSRVWFDYPGLIDAVKLDSELLLDDGKLSFRVSKITKHAIHCTAQTTGVLFGRKGISIVGGGVTAACLTQKDHADLHYACGLGVDLIALSFPARAEDIVQARQVIQKEDAQIGIIAKIERKAAIDNLDAIIEASDLVMVARGDLALEAGDSEVPVLQKHIIKQGRFFATPVIVATHMMESMVSSPTPTRAEVSDVANAVLDGADAVMLSAETAMGEYPATVIEKVDSICKRIEKHPHMHASTFHDKYTYRQIDEAIAYSAMYLANRMEITAAVALTESGRTPAMMSRVRSGIPIYALSRFAKARAKMCMMKDVYPIPFDLKEVATSKSILKTVVTYLVEVQVLSNQDIFLLTHGEDMMVQGKTSTLKVCKVIDVLAEKAPVLQDFALSTGGNEESSNDAE